MKIHLTKEEVTGILTDYIIETYRIDVGGKEIIPEYFYGDFKLEIRGAEGYADPEGQF